MRMAGSDDMQWQSGAIFGGLVDYWFYTGDEGYLNQTIEAIMFQTGDDDDFMPLNQTHTLVCTLPASAM